uniref:beta strand repeat-containing protein n=1 Tax=Rhodoferax ferrireducens TaxID=192843 RepID=UPI0013009E11
VPAGVTGFAVTVPTLTDSINGEPIETLGLTIGGVQGIGGIVDIDRPPVNTVPAAQTTLEDTNLVFSGARTITVADVNGGSLTTTISVGNGTLLAVTGGGATITNNGTSTVTISGTAAQINAALNGLAYRPTADYNGPATLTVATSDGTATDTDTVAITVSAVVDIASDTITTLEDTPITFNPITGTNGASPDNFENAGRAVSAINGTAITVGGSVVVTGGTVTLNADATLTYTPNLNYNGAPSFTYTVSSGGVSETANINVTVAARVGLSVQDVQHWTFNEGSGTTTTNIYPTPDQTGTRTDGIAGGTNLSPIFTSSGHEGSGMQFNGIWSNTSSTRDGGYVALPTSVTNPLRGDGAGAGSASLVFWINTTQTGGTIGWNSPSVIGMENNGGTVDVQWGWLNNTGRIGFGMADDAGIMSTNPVNDGAWHNVAINHNFQTGATEVWVDGILNSTGTLQAGAIMPNNFLGFGVTADDGAATDRYLNGKLDDVRIYNRVLTSSQIQAIYAVESTNLGASAVLDNDGGPVRFTVTATDYSQITVSGAPIGATLTDGGTHSTLITTTGQVVDITGWVQSELAVTGLGTTSAMLEVTATGVVAGDSTTQYINIVTGSTVFNGSAAANTQTGTAASEFFSGMGGNDTINAGAGDDRVFGGIGNDTISGGTGKDVIVGGVGNDTMTGGIVGTADSDSDVFIWSLGDAGTTATPAVDTLNLFTTGTAASGGDVLNLKDLLTGEANNGTSLDNYLHFNFAGGNTTLYVSTTGAFGDNNLVATNPATVTNNDVQQIVFTGVNLTSGFTSDSQVINDLISKGKLITD